MTETKDPAAPLLIVTGGPRDGAELPFGEPGEKTLGSSADCDLSIELGNVEAFHARVSWDFQGLSIVDSGSATGTYVNGEKIAGERPLGDGDRVCLGPPGSKGSVKLLVRLPAEALSLDMPTSAPAAADDFSLSSDDSSPSLPAAEAFSLDDEPPAFGAGSVEIPKLELEAAHEAPPVSVGLPPTPPPVPEPPAPAPVRKPSKPEYNSEMPSIAPNRPRETPTLPPVARETPRAPKVKKAAFDLSRIPKPALYGVPALVLLLGAWVVYSGSQAPPPVLDSVTPGKVETGGTVTIAGKGFSTDLAKNVVRFGDQTGTVTAASETQLAVKVPNMEGGERKLVVESQRSRSNALNLTIFKAPSIAKLEPDVAMPGDEIVATGMNLSGGPLNLFVGSQQAEVQQATPTSFHFRMPQIPGAEGRVVGVSLQVGPDSAKGMQLILGHLPLVMEVAPATGAAGDRVTLRGRGFDTNATGNAVTFGGQQVLVLSATASELVVVAPASDRQVPISVQALGRTSSANASFTVTRASVATFLLRYFASPALDKPGHDVVFVSTELGPTLMLGGKGDAPSTAERAMRVAAAMNAVAEQATSVPVRLEARDKPAGIGVTGSPQLLVAVTPEDVAAYPGRLTPRGLAAFWTALVQDELALFAMRDRPNAVIQLTPHGRVLMEIYAEAVHRSGLGGGVSQSIVSPLAPARAKDLRDLALLPPSEGQAISAAAVEGSWDGDVEESGVGSKQVQVRLHTKGSQLSGTITSRSGKLTAEVPLSEVSFQGGTLSFALTSGAAPRYFRGTLQGSSISGTIHDKPGAKDSIGQFKLTFVE